MSSFGATGVPQLYGLVLAGGKSRRMGHDKGMIEWHGRPQRYHIADLLAQVCSEVYISCRADQIAEIPADYKTLIDKQSNGGPFEAIIGALESSPGTAWLVVACDLPLVDLASLEYLVKHRNTAKLATAYIGSQDLPEPLIAIWEPASLEKLLSYRQEDISCPRKSLIKMGSQVELIAPPKKEIVLNANTPDEAKIVQEILGVRTRND